jgi:hypothetical protein
LARSISETQQVRYLLGLSSPEEREHIESEYFEDEDAFQQMLAAEDDLIDAYSRGELAGEERRRFEKNFVSSFDGRDRVRFARAFASVVSDTEPVTTGTLLKRFQSPRLFQTATITTIIILVVAFAWLVIDRRRTINELRDLHAESSEASEALQRGSDSERTRTTQPVDLRTQTDKPRHRERATTASQRAPLNGVSVEPVNTYSLTPRNVSSRGDSTVRGTATDPNGRVTTAAETALNISDATLGNSFETKRITELPLNASNVVGLLSLQPGVSRTGSVNGGRTDQSNITLDGVDVNAGVPGSLGWIRFQITLETAAIYDNYRVIIKTADGRPVTSVDWTEPLTPNQTIIDTPAISTVDLTSGDYVLLLMGKEPDGSFVKVAEYSFKII